jgi:hypothetical protein
LQIAILFFHINFSTDDKYWTRESKQEFINICYKGEGLTTSKPIKVGASFFGHVHTTNTVRQDLKIDSSYTPIGFKCATWKNNDYNDKSVYDPVITFVDLKFIKEGSKHQLRVQVAYQIAEFMEQKDNFNSIKTIDIDLP